jgi:hypothetical protein
MLKSGRTVRSAFIGAILLLAACELTPPPPPGEAQLRATVPPQTNSAIVVKTAPMAACIVRPAEEAATNAMARFFADQQGNARFFVHPTGSPDEITRLIVQCEAGGTTTSQTIALRASTTPTADFPPPPPPPKPIGKIRPGLSRETAVSLSDQELARRGYPLPPDPQLSPDGFERWLRAVTNPVTVINPVVVTNPYVRHDYGNTRNGPATSNNWSGVELRGTAGPFAWVSAWWNVPVVTGESKTQTNSSTWVGIDGDGTNDLAQAGTEQDAFGTGNATVTTYRAWTELLPNQPTESVIPNLTINPGDQVFTEVYIANAGGSPSLNGAFMTVCLENLSSSGSYCFGYTSLGGTRIGGSEAEWITERPSLCDSKGNCTLAELANFGNVPVFTTNVLARRSNSARHQGYVGCCGSGSFLINMTSDGTATGTILDTVNLDSGTINFKWAAFH